MTAAVLFDLYETLVTEREGTPARASGLGERLGIDAVAFRNAWKRQRHRIVRGEVTFADGLLAAGFMCGRTLNDDLVQRLSRERRSEKALLFQHFDPVGFGVLRELRNRGCRLGVVSNCFAEDVAAWPSCQAAECFDASVFSFEVGCAKPEPPIYHEALRRLGVAASHACLSATVGMMSSLAANGLACASRKRPGSTVTAQNSRRAFRGCRPGRHCSTSRPAEAR
jgi:putative hydrolase of the HAD superfamily